MVRAADLAKAQSCDDDVILDVLDDNKLHLKAVSEALFFYFDGSLTGRALLFYKLQGKVCNLIEEPFSRQAWHKKIRISKVGGRRIYFNFNQP